MAPLNIDRYHATMGDAAYKPETHLHDKLLSEAQATFYVTQRKLPLAPCVGHERLIRSLADTSVDHSRCQFLEQDRGGLTLFAQALGTANYTGAVRAVLPGTIMFAGEPFADITGPFALTQAQEIKFEHAFDLPMTTAQIAFELRAAAGDRWLSDFSLRRNGDVERAIEIAKYAFIGGFNDTSNMEAAYRLQIPAVGTAAHYWQQAYVEYMREPEVEPRTSQPKHFEQVAFERWLDANPQGTTLLLDTVDVRLGAAHAAMAATSTEARRRAFKGFRIDSGDLARLGRWCLHFFEANGLYGLMPILTGDLDAEQVRRLVREFPEAAGFGIGTKLAGEVHRIAGVIFKLCLIADHPTLKASHTPEKSTLSGKLQVYRGADRAGRYVADCIGLEDEEIDIPGAASIERLLVQFWENGQHESLPSLTTQRDFVEEQQRRFPDINNYLCTLSPGLRSLRDELTAQMHDDASGWHQVLNVPEELKQRWTG